MVAVTYASKKRLRGKGADMSARLVLLTFGSLVRPNVHYDWAPTDNWANGKLMKQHERGTHPVVIAENDITEPAKANTMILSWDL